MIATATDRLVEIFTEQRRLMTQFMEIERSHGLLQTDQVPVDLQSFQGQARIRDFAWRFTEELMEALGEGNPELELEELADALHFLVELAIYADFDPLTLKLDNDKGDALEGMFRTTNWSHWVDPIAELANSVHYLRNRPHKQKARPIEESHFRLLLRSVFFSFAGLCRSRRVRSGDLYDAYFAKAKINQGRITNGT